MKKIIHMTDMHVGYEKLDLETRFRKVIDELSPQNGYQPDDYVVVITGDLVDEASQDNYDKVKICLNKFEEKGFKNVLLIPGNHDYINKKNKTTNYAKMFNRTFYKSTNVVFPLLNIIPESGGDDAIAFIGLNTMEGELPWKENDPTRNVGELGNNQLTKRRNNNLKSLLKRDDVKNCGKRVVYLHHYPLFHVPTLKLKDADKLGDILKESINNGVSIDALLFGHYHIGIIMNDSPDWGIPRCYDGGTATGKPEPMIFHALGIHFRTATRCIDLSQSPDKDTEL